MTNSNKYSLKAVFFLGSIALLFAFGMNSCADPSGGDDDMNLNEPSQLVTDRIFHTHVKGTDPCPQAIVQVAKVYCGAGPGDCEVDSAVITNVSSGLTALFSNGQTSAPLLVTDGLAETITFAFTCGIATSFVHTYAVKLYKDGVFVKEEDIVVDVIVE
jgi:hypothetical protein